MTNAKKDELPPEAQENLRGLRELRMIFGLTQKKLAERVGQTESCIKAYENGYNLPTFEKYSRLAEYFGWDKDNPPPPRKTLAPLKPSPVESKPPKVESVTQAIKSKPQSRIPAQSKRIAMKVSFRPDSDPRRPHINVKFTEGSCYEIHDNENVPAQTLYR